MKKILFYQLNESFKNTLENEERMIENLMNNQNTYACKKQLRYLLKKQDVQQIIQKISNQCEELSNLTIQENVIHFMMGKDIFEQIIVFDYYLTYEYDNEYKILYKKIQKVLCDYKEINESQMEVVI